MGNTQSMQKINFEDMQSVCRNPETYILINTLLETDQDCLIRGTVNIKQEEILINKYIHGNKQIKIIIYGRNCNDDTVIKKYNQLIKLGFNNVYIYTGGLFEWLMLQDIYGFEEFPTTIRRLDFLRYKPGQKLNIVLLEY
jgi:hypothetical protein